MSSTKTTDRFSFEVTAAAGDARVGELRVNGAVLSTPNIFPVVNFYAGGTEQSVFGGGIHRTVKEFMIGADRIGGESFDKCFDGAMTSVSSLTDYNVTRERFESYIDTPIKQRKLFSPFGGLVFVDSGGFKFLSNPDVQLGSFETEMDQETVYGIQRAMGGDIIINLDYPIAPNDSRHERLRKAKKTAENIHTFLSLSREFNGALYLSLHGYNYSMMDEFLSAVTEIVPAGILREGFDGIALGSLVPKKDDRSALIQAVTDCRELMTEWGIANWPLHVLGISSGAIPLLVSLGVDSFDSSSYLYSAINGKYSTSLTESVHIDEADFSQCNCPICQSELHVNHMQGNVKYQKDALGPVAMHNLLLQKRELATIRQRIEQQGTSGLVQYLEDTFREDKIMRSFAHKVVNQSLGGYF